VAHVTVAEYRADRRALVSRARRASARRAPPPPKAAAGRAVVELADVADVLRARPAAWDLVSLDTDNGPEWLVRDENAGLYSAAGARASRAAPCAPAASLSSGHRRGTPHSGTCCARSLRGSS
jgi:spermidine synthase